mmetsp:Transcript_9689/g.19459  ORF Transcript_9689/g.19459 Transcript_9689/m.19459 type:complete len:91 (-) Transcript_9689:15-287(-)
MFAACDGDGDNKDGGTALAGVVVEVVVLVADEGFAAFVAFVGVALGDVAEAEAAAAAPNEEDTASLTADAMSLLFRSCSSTSSALKKKEK